MDGQKPFFISTVECPAVLNRCSVTVKEIHTAIQC
jgi:hypothetical protein